ncbi:MAG: hypothetical protein SFU83_10145 [Meiothermus sp.]|nr:hypothetical protein [Meiothermus sp.]
MALGPPNPLIARDLEAAFAALDSPEQLPPLLDLVLAEPEAGERVAQSELANPTTKPRALAALLVQAEAMIRRGQGKAAVLVLGKALGLQEWMGQEFSGLTLAMLAEAQALWGNLGKAQQTAEKALERSQDPYSQSRALWAMSKATGEASWAGKARDAAAESGCARWVEYLGIRVP